jgi:hypothetical protein
MSTPVFKILIDGEYVTGEYGKPGYQPSGEGQAKLNLNELTLETVGLMNRWLSFWDLIQVSKIRRKECLLEPRTLKVLGTQLWRLILDNDVGQALIQRIPKEGKPPIRLSIEFDTNANSALKGLPWEFLFEPENEWFLATKTELLLTRYVTVPGKVATVGQVGEGEGLRALLIVALPIDPDYPTFDSSRVALGRLRKALKDVPNLEVAELIDVWDPQAISGELKAKEYHIVHVVGICRGDPGEPQIYLGGEGDGFHDPAQFVDCLTDTAPQPRPRLVILQLCDYKDGDASENFERMAPALIKGRVPAVLALQYAAMVDEADKIGLGKQFYESLVKGDPIGAAVQASRHRLQKDRLDRRFGTPVLYLQEDGALRRPGSGAGAGEASARPEPPGGPTIRERLLTDLEGRGFQRDELRPFLTWLRELGPQPGLEEIKNRVYSMMFDPPDQHQVPQGLLEEAYLALRDLEGGHAAS